MNEIRRNVPVDEQIEILKRGVVDLVTEDDLRRKLEQSLKTGKPLRVKLGADPTRPDLHLGHAVILRKMRQFQDLGHQVIMLIGDFTAMIGDPSGKSKTRPPLTLEETRANAQSYLEQCRLILRGEPEVLEIRYNGEWLEPMGYADVIRLASKYTVARILERDDFTKRLQAQTPISLHELLYPVTQGYDSVALEADVELGGTDQLFNNLVGRALQRDYGQEAQVVMTLPLLVGLRGNEKMSKSLDNYISLEIKSPKINAKNMFKELMKLPDDLMESYFTLLTDLTENEILIIIQQHPKVSHRILASLISNSIYNQIEPNIDSIKKLVPNDYNIAFGETGPTLEDLEEYAHTADRLEVFLDTFRDVFKDNLGLYKTIKDNFNDIEDFKATMQKALYIFREFSLTIEKFDELENFLDVVKGSKDLIKNSDNTKIIKDLYVLRQDMLKYLIDKKMDFNNYPTDPSLNQNVVKAIMGTYEADEGFKNVAKGGIPDNIPTIDITADLNDSLDADRISMAKLVVLAGLEPSNGAARKLIQNRGLKLNGETYADPQGQLTRQELAAKGGAVIQKGKDKFARFVLES
ncbi:tyrosine--tRNA ligase [Deinococcus marmoris]|uniref:tyrosine--tRNA ligase n=1 Tax=Deinococcus marmoris TaxID=249408 RepID=UPI000A845707|nr:tyrosine--tRNA ligase [Deinococcus marmoris]